MNGRMKGRFNKFLFLKQVKIIEQNLAAQENIINKLTSLYAAYGESRRLLSDVLRKREGLINGEYSVLFSLPTTAKASKAWSTS